MEKHSKKAAKQNKNWIENLNNRMACHNLLYRIERLNYPWWIATMETKFGGFLSIEQPFPEI